MNKRERVLAALNGEPVDHVPAAFWFHFAGDEVKGETNVQAHLKYFREADLDFIKIMDDGYTWYPAPAEVVIEGRWDLVKPLDANHPYITGQVERAKRIVDELGGEAYAFYNVFSPLITLRFVYDAAGKNFDALSEDLKAHPVEVMEALDAIAVTQSLLSRLVIEEAGVDGIYYSVQGAEPGRFTLEEHRKLVRPSDLYVLDHANRYSETNIAHLCGWAGNRNDLDKWRDYPAKAVNWAVSVECLSLVDGRAFFGNRTVLGGFETHWDGTVRQGIIYDGTEEQIKDYTRKLILDFGKRGLILGGDCTVDASIDWEHIRWVREASAEL